jgi:ABC-type nitrate/sulfonate/bicarbonate transport system permease component
MFAAWEVAGRSGMLGPSWPAFSRVAAFILAAEHRTLLLDAAFVTSREAACGFALGSIAGCACALLAVLVPATAYGIDRFAAIVNGIPVIAIGSLCAVTLPPAVNPVVVASLAVFFMLFVAATAGFAATPHAQRDVLRVLGATRAVTFRQLQLPAALPAIADGLRLSAPVSVVGAIIGEWFAAENGLGPLLVNAMQNYQIDLLWSAALIGALISAAWQLYDCWAATSGPSSLRLSSSRFSRRSFSARRVCARCRPEPPICSRCWAPAGSRACGCWYCRPRCRICSLLCASRRQTASSRRSSPSI